MVQFIQLLQIASPYHDVHTRVEILGDLDDATGREGVRDGDDEDTGLLDPRDATGVDVLNGIAYDAEPEIMKEQLAFFHEALRETRLRTYAQGFVEEAEEYFGKWGDEGVVELYETGNELTIYTSSRSLLGNEFRQRLSGEFARLFPDLGKNESPSKIDLAERAAVASGARTARAVRPGAAVRDRRHASRNSTPNSSSPASVHSSARCCAQEGVVWAKSVMWR